MNKQVHDIDSCVKSGIQYSTLVNKQVQYFTVRKQIFHVIKTYHWLLHENRATNTPSPVLRWNNNCTKCTKTPLWLTTTCEGCMRIAKLVRCEQAHSVRVALVDTTLHPSSLHCKPAPNLTDRIQTVTIHTVHHIHTQNSMKLRR